jgi:hypothetical protein
VQDRVRELFRIKHGHRLPRYGVCTTDDNVILGEYWSNPERMPINIYRIEPSGRRSEVLYRFDSGQVRHIHAVQKDSYSELIWLMTGDEDSECMIASLDLENGELKQVGVGSQKWRTVSLAFRPEAIYWGTDDPVGHNHIWRLDRSTGETKSIGDVIGPVYYNVCLDDYIVFGTTVEKGEGQQDGLGRLYAVDAEDRIVQIWERRKDLWDAHLFGYGIFEFALGHLGNNQFWVTEKGYKGRMRSILLQLRDE